MASSREYRQTEMDFSTMYQADFEHLPAEWLRDIVCKSIEDGQSSEWILNHVKSIHKKDTEQNRKLFCEHFKRDPTSLEDLVLRRGARHNIPFREVLTRLEKENIKEHQKEFTQFYAREPLQFELEFIQKCVKEDRSPDWMVKNLPERSSQISTEMYEKEMTGQKKDKLDIETLNEDMSKSIEPANPDGSITKLIESMEFEDNIKEETQPKALDLTEDSTVKGSFPSTIDPSLTFPEKKKLQVADFAKFNDTATGPGSVDSMITCTEDKSNVPAFSDTVRNTSEKKTKISATPIKLENKSLTREYREAYQHPNKPADDTSFSITQLASMCFGMNDQSHDSSYDFKDEVHAPNFDKLDRISEESHYYEKLIKETIFEIQQGMKGNMKPFEFKAQLKRLDEDLKSWFELVGIKKHTCEKYGFQEEAKSLYETEWQIRTAIKEIKREVYEHVNQLPDRLKLQQQHQRKAEYSDFTSEEESEKPITSYQSTLTKRLTGVQTNAGSWQTKQGQHPPITKRRPDYSSGGSVMAALNNPHITERSPDFRSGGSVMAAHNAVKLLKSRPSQRGDGIFERNEKDRVTSQTGKPEDSIYRRNTTSSNYPDHYSNRRPQQSWSGINQFVKVDDHHEGEVFERIVPLPKFVENHPLRGHGGGNAPPEYIRERKATTHQNHADYNDYNSAPIAYTSRTSLKQEVPKLDARANVKEFYQFKAAFENLMNATRQSGNQKLIFLQKAVESRDFREDIMDFPFSEEGFQDAMETLEIRFGGKQALINSRLKEIERFNHDTHKSKGLFKLRGLIKSILADPKSHAELSSTSLLYSRIICLLPRETHDKYADKFEFPEDRNLYTLCGFLEKLAKHKQEQETLHEFGTKRETNKPSFRAKHYSTTVNDATDKRKPDKQKSGPCVVCKGPHFVYSCLKDKPWKEIYKIVKEKKLCFNCLSDKHGLAACTSERRCRKCEKKHNTLLHLENNTPKGSGVENKRSDSTIKDKAENNEYKVESNYIKPKDSVEKKILLPVKYSAFVVPAEARNIKSGQVEETIVYFDQGADETWISTELAEKLNLEPLTFGDCTITTVTGLEHYDNTPIVELEIQSMDKKTKYDLRCRVMDNIPQCSYQDWSRVKSKYPFLSKVPLHTTSVKKVGLCIGRDHCHLLMPEDTIDGGKNKPKAFKMKIGWTICVPKQHDETATDCFSTETVSTLADYMKARMSIGTNGDMEGEETSKPLDVITYDALRKLLFEDNLFIEEKPPFNKDEETAFNFVRDNFKFTEEGRPMTAIPFNDKIKILPNNYASSMARLYSLYNRLEKKDITNVYSEKFKEGEMKDYIEEVKDDRPDIGPKWYMPQEVVVKVERTTSKARIVNNAAAKHKRMSLNDTLRAGPNLQEDMLKILFRFRKESFVISLDVKEMFPQVIVRPEDRDWLRVLIREPGGKTKIYRHTRLPFGLNCSPFIAQYTVQSTAERHQKEFPLGHKMITESRYVDDVIASLPTQAEAIQALHETLEIFKKCGMEAHKVLSNDTGVMTSVKRQIRLEQWGNWIYDEEDLPITKILGMTWNPEKDKMNIIKPKVEDCPTTTREFLGAIAQVYDPQGIVSPFVIKARRLFQRILTAGPAWDEPIDSPSQLEVDCWFQQLDILESLEFPRKIVSGTPKSLHIFADSSDYAYGYAVYLQSDKDCGLICGKAKVHTLKPLSIPRKELQAAVLASKIIPFLKAVWPDLEITLWTDSVNCLAWIQSDSRQYKSYINNRVSAILDFSKAEQWRWVDTANNPADIASRGMDLKQLKENKLWWRGPQFLWDNKVEWPENKKYFKTEEDLKPNKIEKIFANHIRLDWLPNINQYETLEALIEANANALKRLNNQTGNLTAADREESKMILIKDAQAEVYENEIKELQHGRQVPKKSSIANLNPFIDTEGVLRCGSRLQEGPMVPEETSIPILLPKDHHLTSLIIKHEHEKTKCAYGSNYTLAEIRRKYWIPRGPQQVKKLISKCRQCKLNRGLPKAPKMAALPFTRTEGTGLPFTHASVDFSGAYLTKQGRGRGKQKRYLCLFCCNETRAVHLELAPNLETDGFIMALNNFTYRRGKIKTLTCDNGTNFRGAERELKLLIDGLNQDELEDYASKHGFKFRFNPPGAPHMGGVFESLIKSSKRAIRAVLKDAEFTDLELQSAFNGAEDILNSRPLGYQSNDPNDFRVLTPASFLHGRLDGHVLPATVDTQPYNHKQRWRLVQNTLNHIWKRWLTEILPTLGPRQKWTQDTRNFEVGDEVLVVDKNLPRYRWNIARITATYPGRDGVVRTVDIQGENGHILKTPVVKLIPLS